MSALRKAVALLAFAVVALLASWPVAPAAATAAQSGFEHVEHFTSDMEITPAGSLRVHETIDYDFGSLSRHGIYRFIPVRFPYDSRYDRVYPVHNVKVTAGSDTPSAVDISEQNGNVALRIGDPDRTITGRHRYDITYDVDGALNTFPDHDELYWNVTGNRWVVPISRADATLRGPIGFTKITCFEGPEHSDLPCDESAADGGTAHYGSVELGTGAGLTIVAALPRGAIANVRPILDERWSLNRAFARTPITVGSAVILLAAIALLLTRVLWRHGRDRRLVGDGVETLRPLFDHGDSPVEYRPPDELRPAQVGVLIDERADPLDVTASIIDLGVRGYLRIEEIPDKGLFSRGDWRLTKLDADAEALEPYERKLLKGLFDSGDEVLMSDLKSHFYDDLKQIQDSLYDDCVKRGWFRQRPDRTRAAWLGIGIAATVLGVGAVVLAAAYTHFALALLPLAIVGIVVLAVHNRMPARTGAGAKTLEHILGFRRFMTTAQTQRMQFAEEEGIFAKYLPYAIVFGATKQWARRFEGLGADSPAMGGMGWYLGANVFNPVGFSDSMHDFTVSTAGTIVSTPPSASGSSG
ncbi:MAG: DUF2207 domain-containing protein, partial [Actinobacteria bacterium]|nr:DUF2207 domain-containing protein [Actinomycetota bacterium]